MSYILIEFEKFEESYEAIFQNSYRKLITYPNIDDFSLIHAAIIPQYFSGFQGRIYFTVTIAVCGTEIQE